jgi:hypothetical protein
VSSLLSMALLPPARYVLSIDTHYFASFSLLWIVTGAMF